MSTNAAPLDAACASTAADGPGLSKAELVKLLGKNKVKKKDLPAMIAAGRITQEDAAAALKEDRSNLIIGGVIFAVLLFGLLSGKVVERDTRTPEQREQQQLAKSDLAKSGERILRNYILASGQGVCEKFAGAQFTSLQSGTSVHNGGKRFPTIIGSYSGQCQLQIMGEVRATDETYWFRFVDVDGRIFGNILTSKESMDRDNAAALFRKL